MVTPFRRILFASVAFMLSGSAAIAAEPPVDEQFVYYQDKLIGKDSGVYEHDGFLYVMVRIPVQSQNRMRMKGVAMLEFSAQLRRWALEQTRRDRGAPPSWPAAIAKMETFNDEVDPNWRFPPWSIHVDGRQFPQREVNGFFVQGQVYKKDALLKAIPESYRRQPTQDDVMAAFARNVSAAYRKDKAALAEKCGFFELSFLRSLDAAAFPAPEKKSFPKDLESFLLKSRKGDAGVAKKEWNAVNATLAKALRESSVCESFMQGRPVTNEVVTSSVVTNPVVSICAVTNAVVSVQEETGANVTHFAVAAKPVTNFVAATIPVTNRTVSIVRDDSDRAFLSAGLLRPAPGPLTFASTLPAASASAESVRLALHGTPTDPRLWKMLAARYVTDGKPAYSLSCLLNVLALTPSDTDIVAEIALRYADLGCPELARGAAMLAFGTAKDEATRGKVKPLLSK